MKAKHTPGPWVITDDGFIAVYEPVGDDAEKNGTEEILIADPSCSVNIDIYERKANAELIVKAPEVLEVAKLLWDHYHSGTTLNAENYLKAVELLGDK